MSQNRIKYLLISVLGSILLIFTDLYTKHFAVDKLKGTGESSADIVVFEGVFRLHYLENRGAAFSILNGQQWFFIILTLIVCIGLIFVYCKIPVESKFVPLSICLVFLFSGAVGNLYDRIVNGYVVDFLYFELIDFPVFNVADIYVTCSVFLLFVLVMFKYKDNDLAFLGGSPKKDRKDGTDSV